MTDPTPAPRKRWAPAVRDHCAHISADCQSALSGG
jgi:hypothetical protein